jgi:two-component sensor histidine kinase
MGLFGALFIIVTFAYVALEQRSRLLQRDVEETRSNAFFLADHAARLFEVSDLALQQTAALVAGRDWESIQASRMIWDQIHAVQQALPYVDNIWLHDAAGQLRMTSAAYPAPSASIADRDAFRAQVDVDRGFYIGQPVRGRVTNHPTFMISRRLQDAQGRFVGIVAVTVSLSYFDEYWSQTRLAKGGRISLFRGSDGTVLAQYPPPPDSLSFLPEDKIAVEAALAANPESGTFNYMAAGEERIGSYHRVSSLPLYLRVGLPASAYWNPWIGQVKLYGIFALIAFAALAALTSLAVQQLRQQAADAASLKEEVALRTQELQAETAALETLNQTGSALAAELDIDRAVQNVIDAGVKLTGAQFGAFFYDSEQEATEQYSLYALSGAPPEAFAQVPMVGSTSILAPTFVDREVVRSDDVTKDPRYGKNAPFDGMPEGHSPIRSYMAIPLVSPSGDAQGAMLFGHEEPAVFTERSERLIRGLAGQAAIAIENGRLYRAAQKEIAERRNAQTQQSLLIRELHHRVKNTLATVQAVVGATARSTSNIDAFYHAFVGRIVSLANTHSLLTEALWQTASLRNLLAKELSPYNDDFGQRIVLDGPDVELPSEAAVPIGMAIHELTTNAAKYGALSTNQGRIVVRWEATETEGGQRVRLCWRESGGPEVAKPTRQGFGTRLLDRVLATQLNATVATHYDPEGLRVEIDATFRNSELVDPAA